MTKRYYGVAAYGHDAGIAVFDCNGDLEFFAQSERFNPRIKNYNEIENIVNFYPKPSDKDFVCTSSLFPCDTELLEWNKNLVMKSNLHPVVQNAFQGLKPQVSVAHHLCHIVASWCFRKDDQKKFALAFDGSGTIPSGEARSCLGGFIDQKGFEPNNIIDIPSSTVLCNLLGINSAGKAMGLAGYVDNKIKEFDKKDLLTLVYSIINPSNSFNPCYPRFSNDKLNENDINFISKFYKIWIEIIWEKVNENLKNIGDIGVLVGGGTCLALELNTRIYEMKKDLIFGPPVNDSGLALGAAAFGYFMDTGRWPKPIQSPSINYLQEPLPEVGPQDPTDIAKLIADDKVVGLLRGKAECGPRALGFRSILANACKYENLKRVSEDLKGREYYRPLAPVVTSESFNRYFVGPKGEYMQYRCECTEEAQKELPAIVHKDNSARPQVVYKEKDPWLHSLLVEYGRLTGHECVINTSLNGKGKPICNTYQDAVEDFSGKDIKLVSINYKKERFKLI